MEFVHLWPSGEQDIITRKLYRALGRYAVDFLRTSSPLPPHRIHNFELIQPLLDRGKGVIVLLGHFGNWELLADVFGRTVKGLHVVAKPMRNKLVDAWLARKRAAASVETIYTDRALRRIYQALRENKIIAILIDQHAGNQGTPAPFLGRMTSTVRTVAGLVHKTGCAVLPTYALLGEDAGYDIEITVAPEIEIRGKTEEEIITSYQLQHNGILSSWITQHPEHWFGWFHKRFRESIRYNS